MSSSHPGSPPRHAHAAVSPSGSTAAPLFPFSPRRNAQSPATAGLRAPARTGGGDRIRTDDLLRAKQTLSQLSYAPPWLFASPSHAQPSNRPHHLKVVGLSGFEPLTSRLSGGRSNQLSYRPALRRAHRRARTHGRLPVQGKRRGLALEHHSLVPAISTRSPRR